MVGDDVVGLEVVGSAVVGAAVVGSAVVQLKYGITSDEQVADSPPIDISISPLVCTPFTVASSKQMAKMNV